MAEPETSEQRGGMAVFDRKPGSILLENIDVF